MASNFAIIAAVEWNAPHPGVEIAVGTSLTKHPAPLLVMHGTADRLVPVAQAERLYARRNARGLPTDLELVERMPHGWLNDAALPETEQAIERVISFLR